MQPRTARRLGVPMRNFLVPQSGLPNFGLRSSRNRGRKTTERVKIKRSKANEIHLDDEHSESRLWCFWRVDTKGYRSESGICEGHEKKLREAGGVGGGGAPAPPE